LVGLTVVSHASHDIIRSSLVAAPPTHFSPVATPLLFYSKKPLRLKIYIHTYISGEKMSLKYPKIKTIQIKVIDSQYRKLLKKKGHQSWLSFLLERGE